MSEENIHVLIRFRPTNKREKKEAKQKKIKSQPPIFQNNDMRGIGAIEINNTKSIPYHFTFDGILDAKETQESTFNRVGKHVCDDVLIGYNGCIFAYGQTGSGKTYTMFGPEDDQDHPSKMGIIPRSVAYIFSAIEDQPDIIDARIKVSFVEVYNEKLRDLLNPISSSKRFKKRKKAKPKPLSIRLQPNGETRILNVTEKKVLTLLDVLSLIEVASSYRTKAETSMNNSSSRSHMLMTLTVSIRLEDGSMQIGKLNFCDLAGSEKVKKTNASGQRMKEAQKINLSLTVLGQVISSLSQKKKHVPYRDSQLTYLLKDSLGGNCKTTLVVNCTKHMFNRDETISSLRFGSRCKLITNAAIVNRTYSNKELLNMIEKLRRENAQLKTMLAENEVNVLTSPKGNKLFQRKKSKQMQKKEKKVKDEWDASAKKGANDDWGASGSIGVSKKSVDENKKLKKKIKKLQDKYQLLQVQNTELEEKLHESYDQLFTKDKQTTILSEQLVDSDQVQVENDELKLKMKSLEALNDEYRMEIGDMKKNAHYKATKLSHQLEKFKELHNDAQDETSELMDEVLKLKEATEKSEVIIGALEHQLSEKRKDINHLQKELFDKERRVSIVLKEKISLAAQLKEINTTVTENNTALSQKNDTIEQLKDELDQRTQELTAQIHELTQQVEQREVIQRTLTLADREPLEIEEDEKKAGGDYSDVLMQSATIHNMDDVIQKEQSLLAGYEYLKQMDTVRKESTLVDALVDVKSGSNANEKRLSQTKKTKEALEKELADKNKKLEALRKKERPKDKDKRLKLFLQIGSLEDDVVKIQREIKKRKDTKATAGAHRDHVPSKVTTEEVMNYIDAALTLYADDESGQELSLVT